MHNPFAIFWIFLKLGCTSFGGPVAHLAYFRHAFVERKSWFSEEEYAHLVSICQVLPGPASSQVGFAIGLLKGGWLGSLAAFLGFTLPSVVIILFFASQIHQLDQAYGLAAIKGLKILAFAVVLQAVLGMSKQLLGNKLQWCVALFVFSFLLFANNLYIQILLIVLSTLFSYLCYKFFAAKFSSLGLQNKEGLYSPNMFASHFKVSPLFAKTAFFVFLGLWLCLPIINETIYPYAGMFYSTGSLVFGGGHVLLPYLESATVAPHLLTKEVFLSAYGATQALPGPMFSFASYLAHELSSISGQEGLSSYPITSALMAIVFIFLPGFLLLIACLPASQKLLYNMSLKRALAGANSAVVGLLAATLYDPIFTHGLSSKEDVFIAVLAVFALIKLKLSVIAVLMWCVFSSVFFIFI